MFKARKKNLESDQNLSVQSSNRNARKRSEISSSLALNTSWAYVCTWFGKSSKGNNFVKITCKKGKAEAVLNSPAIFSTMTKTTVQKSHF